MDEIRIRRLEVFARHGNLPEETALGQKFLISVALQCDAGRAGRSDALCDSIDYAAVSHLIKKYTEENVFHLLERLAQCLADEILLAYPAVRGIVVEVEKPWAPVMLPLETVSVRIERGWSTVYLGIGSNMGDKEKHLLEAIRLLGEDKRIRVVSRSSFLITKPVGYEEQDDFLNGAVKIETLYSPEELLEVIFQIEAALKRERTIHWGPRTIDLDILLFDDRIIQSERLTVPHREMAKRMFVLEPLCEIAPYAVHPVYGKTIERLKNELEELQ